MNRFLHDLIGLLYFLYFVLSVLSHVRRIGLPKGKCFLKNKLIKQKKYKIYFMVMSVEAQISKTYQYTDVRLLL